MKVVVAVLGLPDPNSPYGLCGLKGTLNLNVLFTELRCCVNVEVAILASPSQTVRPVSVDVTQHRTDPIVKPGSIAV